MIFWNILQTVIFLIFFCVVRGEEGFEEGCTDASEVTSFEEAPFKDIPVTGKGFLYSPGFEENKPYPDNVVCSYKLKAEDGMYVRIHVNDLDIDVTESCNADSLSFYDTYGNGSLEAVYCGNERPYDYVSKSSEIQLFLRSDEFATRRGFNITYSAQSFSGVCSSGEKECRNRKCVSMSVVCDGNDDCEDGTDEEQCSGYVLPYSECGRPEIDPVSSVNIDRIVGGRDAAHGSWPWMAELQASIVYPNAHICGGSLINAQWVLTAAHCFSDPTMRAPESWRIHVGNYHKFKKDPSEQIRYAELIVIYEDINPEEVEDDEETFDIVDDMALIKLNAPIKFGKYVKPVCLPDPQIKVNNKTNCYATGWGSTRGTGGSDRLKQAIHPIQPDDFCIQHVGEEFNSSTMLCAGSMYPLNGACHGDSGGPLACETSKRQWSIIGVTSFITADNMEEGLCGLKDTPSVFNKVAAKTTWIRKVINDNS